MWTAIDYKEGYSWFDVAMSSTGERIVAIGAPGGIFLSEDFGASWEQFADAPDDANYQAVASNSDGQYLAAAISGGPIFMSRDFGVTWRNCTGNQPIKLQTITTTHVNVSVCVCVFAGAPYSAHWYDIAMSGTGQYVVGVEMGGYMHISSDYGQSWEKGMFSDDSPNIHFNLQADFFAVAISETGQHMSIVSSRPSRAVFHSSDFGASFDPSTFDSSVAYMPQQWVSTTLDSTGQNVTIANSLVPGGVFRSTDFGRSFLQVAHAPNVSVVFTRGDGATVGAFDLPMGKPGHIYISLDRGESWNMSSPGGEWTGGAMSATGDFIVAADYSAALYSYLPNCQLGYVHAGFSSDGTNDCVACSPGTVVEQSVCAYIVLPISIYFSLPPPLSLSLSRRQLHRRHGHTDLHRMRRRQLLIQQRRGWRGQLPGLRVPLEHARRGRLLLSGAVAARRPASDTAADSRLAGHTYDRVYLWQR